MKEAYRATFALCSALLRYPDSDLLGSLQDLELKAKDLPGKAREPLLKFLKYIKSSDEHDLQEAYVTTFDFDENNSLHLTYPGFGTRPERGLDLLKLKSLYASEGLQLQSNELPDYLPIMLEFLSVASKENGRILLERRIAMMSKLAKNLETAHSPYSLVLKSCLNSAEELVRLKKELL